MRSFLNPSGKYYYNSGDYAMYKRAKKLLHLENPPA